MQRTDCPRKRPLDGHQSGLASVEMALILPFFLVFMMLLSNIGSFWHAKIGNQIDARTNAYISAMYRADGRGVTDSCKKAEELAESYRNNPVKLKIDAELFAAGLVGTVLRLEKHRVLKAYSLKGSGNTCKGQSFAQLGDRQAKMYAKHYGEDLAGRNQYATAIKSQFVLTSAVPHSTTGRSYHLWSNFGLKDKFLYLLEDYHVVDITGTWHQRDIPKGHDDFLYKQLIENSGKTSAAMQEIDQKSEDLNEWRADHAAWASKCAAYISENNEEISRRYRESESTADPRLDSDWEHGRFVSETDPDRSGGPSVLVYYENGSKATAPSECGAEPRYNG